jgi:hypothetical protein
MNTRKITLSLALLSSVFFTQNTHNNHNNIVHYSRNYKEGIKNNESLEIDNVNYFNPFKDIYEKEIKSINLNASEKILNKFNLLQMSLRSIGETLQTAWAGRHC